LRFNKLLITWEERRLDFFDRRFYNKLAEGGGGGRAFDAAEDFIPEGGKKRGVRSVAFQTGRIFKKKKKRGVRVRAFFCQRRGQNSNARSLREGGKKKGKKRTLHLSQPQQKGGRGEGMGPMSPILSPSIREERGMPPPSQSLLGVMCFF